MRNIALYALILTGIVNAAPATAAEPVTVFGLNLGGKLKAPFRQCTMKEIGTDVRSLCWVSPAFMSKGWRSGSIEVPGAGNHPAWAAHGSFDAVVAQDGTLGELKVRTYPVDKFHEIMKSISARFGHATQFTSLPESKALIASWDRSDVKIDLLCTPKIDCHTTFTSPARAAYLAREKSAQREKESSRPLSP